MAYVDGGDAIVTGGLSGWAYIVSCRTFEIQGQLDHGGVFINCLLVHG